MKKLLIIDGNSIINRTFYAIRMLTTKDGTPTNAVYGFLNILFKNLDELNPDYIAVSFDLKGKTFRHEMYEGYKAHRKGMPDELAVQLPILKEILSAMKIAILEKEGYEADDIIGTVSKMCEDEGVNCFILTGDKDDLQLASGKTFIVLTTTSKGQTIQEVYDDKKVLEKYNVTPKEFIDVKGLMGDPSDNIPGVAGIGEKTALSLISQYHSIENIYSNIDNLDVSKSVKEKLACGKESAYLSKVLATIDKNVPLGITLADLERRQFNKEELIKVLSRLEFNAIIKKLDLAAGKNTKAADEDVKVNIIDDLESLKDFKEKILKAGRFSYLLLKDGHELAGAAFCFGGEVYTARFSFNINPNSFEEIFESPCPKISHSTKEDIRVLAEYGIDLKNIVFDTEIAAYLIEPQKSNYNLERLSFDFLNISIKSEEEVLGKGKAKKKISELSDEEFVEFSAKRCAVLERLSEVLLEKIKELGLENLFYDIELPLTRVLANMELAGFKVDRTELMNFGKKLEAEIKMVEQAIYLISGEEFNISSTKQLGKVLFEDLKLPVVKKTKTGYSTDVEVLEKLLGKHEIIEYIIRYRQLTKLKSTYIDGLLAVINPQTDKIHSTLNQTITVTGRISSTEPNLQNIPIKLELGREIRKMFTASGGDYVLVDADYSQIELRVLAHISGDETMINAFLNNEDIHTTTASQVFGVPKDMVTPRMRSDAKAVNFGIVYGISDFSLAQDIGVSRKEAKNYIDNYFKKYHKVKEYMDSIIASAKEKGYVTTLFGRRRAIPELYSSNFNERSFGERVALNTPIQGTAADIIKIAMVRVFDRLNKEVKKSRLILQVHDELIVEAHKDEVDKVVEILKTEMENAAKLKVPLVVDIKCGYRWYDTK